MDPAGLLSLPDEVLLYLFLFLLEADLLSLCHSCVRLYDIMNEDRVWKRFITDEVRSLEHQPQQVSPDNPLPDLGLCENRKHLMRKRRLVSNWRNQRCVKSEVDIGDRYRTREVFFYRNNYVLNVKDTRLELWDISSVPVLQCSMDILLGKQRPECYIIADQLVICLPKCVYVFQVNIHDGCISFLYWFHPKENQVIYEKFPGIVEERNWRLLKEVFCGVGNRLAYLEHSYGSRHYPALHLWDIAKGSKVGVFVAPLPDPCLYFYSCYDNDLIIETEGGEEKCIFKFNLVTTSFSNPVVLEPYANLWLYHKNNFMTYQWVPSAGQMNNLKILSIYDLDSSVKLVEKIYDRSYQVPEVVHEGRYALCYDMQVFIMDLLSLKTLCVVPRVREGRWITRLISVFGLWCLLITEDFKELEVWDVSNNTPTLLKHTQDADDIKPFVGAKGEAPFSKLLYYPYWLDYNVSRKMMVWHFW